MKQKQKFLTSLLLATIILGNTSLSALSYTGIGRITEISREAVGDGLYYSAYKGVDESEKGQEAYILEYKAGRGVISLLSYGNRVYGMDRLASLVTKAEEGGSHPIAAVNGDFYSMKTGVPMGVMINGGEIISTDDGKYALGFLPDGSAIIGKPEMTVTVTNLSKAAAPVQLGQINKYPTVWGSYMTTDTFSSTTHSTSESREVTLALSGKLSAGGSVSATVVSNNPSVTNSEIPAGGAVITVAKSHAEYSVFESFSEGDSLLITVGCTPGWERVTMAIGGGDLMVSDGVVVEGISDEAHEKVSNPRTAVGIRGDGTVVFFAVAGRSDTSRGLKLSELAAVMAEQGCVSAVNLDGGGSTTLMVRPTATGQMGHATKPTDSSYRALANGIIFVTAEAPDGLPGALSPTPSAKFLLRGSTVDFKAAVLDRGYMPLGEIIETDGLKASFLKDYGDAGTVSGGSFTAGFTEGEYYFRISSAADPEISGETSIIVTTALDSLELEKSYIKLIPGSGTHIGIAAEYAGFPVICDSKSFYYTLNGEHNLPNPEDYPTAALVCDYGYLDNEGSFQSFGGVEGQVTLGVWFDQFVRYITLDINDDSEILADFESAEQILSFSSDGILIPSGGYKSSGGVGAAYAFSEIINDVVLSVTPKAEVALFEGAKSLKIYISGGEGLMPVATLKDGEGNEYTLIYTVTKDYTRQLGWRELTAEIPEELDVSGMRVGSVLSLIGSGSGEGVVLLDRPTVYYGEKAAAPISGLESHWAEDAILTLYDMTVIEDADCTGDSEGLYYLPDKELTRGEFAKLLIRYLGIDEEQYAEGGMALDAGTPADKIPYVRAVIAEGLMSGRGLADDGSVIFDPLATITRQEVFKVLGSLLECEPSPITFADSGEIASWAAQGVAKCVGGGLVKGYYDNTLRPAATISRAEIAALLTRLS